MNRKPIAFIVVFLFLGISFVAGYWWRGDTPKGKPSIIKPQPASVADDSSDIPGTVPVSPEKQQLMGVRLATVEKLRDA